MRNEPADLTEAEAAMYAAFERQQLIPLWTEMGDLMPSSPRSRTVAHCWRWRELLEAAETAGALVPVGRGGERRAIALANPGLERRPFATRTLWAAIQYLNPAENAPEHRHSQNAFRFVVEGEGVWTVVDGDAVAMRRGDFLPQPGGHWHSHINTSDRPMAWIDGLDIPLQSMLEATFFEPGAEHPDPVATPPRSRSEQLWAHAGLAPGIERRSTGSTPLLAYRWEQTDRALDDQLEVMAADPTRADRPGHAVVRFVDPTNGDDVLPTMRVEFHRLLPGVSPATEREVGSSVFQVFEGSGRVRVGDRGWELDRGDLFVVPSWQPWSVAAGDDGLDLFRFGDAPVMERLGLHRREVLSDRGTGTTRERA